MLAEFDECVGRFLLPDCKRKSNYEGLGSSLTFHRATVAYALLFNLTITSEPCARPQTSFSLTQESLADRRTTAPQAHRGPRAWCSCPLLARLGSRRTLQPL